MWWLNLFPKVTDVMGHTGKFSERHIEMVRGAEAGAGVWGVGGVWAD